MLSIMIREFIQNQILGMKWMSTLIGNLLEKIGLDTSSKMGGSVQFFLYDVLKTEKGLPHGGAHSENSAHRGRRFGRGNLNSGISSAPRHRKSWRGAFVCFRAKK